MNITTSSTNPQSTPRGEIGKALRSLRGAWVAVAIFSMVANVMLLAPTIYMLQVYDRVMVSGSELTLLAVSLIVLLLLAFMARGIRHGHYHREEHLDVESSGIFWHMCDLIWLLVYPVIYLS